MRSAAAIMDCKKFIRMISIYELVLFAYAKLIHFRDICK